MDFGQNLAVIWKSKAQREVLLKLMLFVEVKLFLKLYLSISSKYGYIIYPVRTILKEEDRGGGPTHVLWTLKSKNNASR